MMTELSELQKYHLECRDGTIGKIKDVFFDDELWVVRYVVADTGGWLTGRRVLLSPAALIPEGAAQGKLPVNLTKTQIESSPGIEADLPVSEQYQRDLHEYYGWQPYWGVAPYPMAGMLLPPVAATPGGPAAPVPAGAGDAPRGDPHLHSAAHVRGYDIDARDGTIGHITDFIVQLDDWTIGAVLIDTRNWLPGRTVVVPSKAIDGVRWGSRKVSVHIDRESVKAAPEYDPTIPMTPEFEQRLAEHFRGASVRR